MALLLLAALLVGILPVALASDDTGGSALAAADDAKSTSMEESDAVESIPEEPTPDKVVESDADISQYGQYESEDGEPLSDDGHPLSRRQVALLRAASAAVGKSTCVNFSGYTSPSWHCNRYYTDGTHAYGHYYYCATISYHTIDGEYCYCIEPNTSSVAGATYTSYSANSASSSSYWMYELDATQRSHIQKILAFGYPACDYGYSAQAQYAATQVLIWEVVARQRYADINEASDYGLYYAVKSTLGNDLYSPYMAILGAISSGISDGTVPSFAGSSYGSAAAVNLSLNMSTGCYEGSVTDSNGVLGHYTFAASGVTFTKSGNTLYISVPAGSAASVKGAVITGTSDQKLMSTSNPSVWENSTYQTVLSSGGADYAQAYIKLNWTDTGIPTTSTPWRLTNGPTPLTCPGWSRAG